MTSTEPVAVPRGPLPIAGLVGSTWTVEPGASSLPDCVRCGARYAPTYFAQQYCTRDCFYRSRAEFFAATREATRLAKNARRRKRDAANRAQQRAKR